MFTPQSAFRNRLLQFASGLRFPKLVLFAAVLFGLDLVIPDVIPFFDEIMLGLLMLILASLKKRSRPTAVYERGRDERSTP
jgi:hypothetical protein